MEYILADHRLTGKQEKSGLEKNQMTKLFENETAITKSIPFHLLYNYKVMLTLAFKIVFLIKFLVMVKRIIIFKHKPPYVEKHKQYLKWQSQP